MCLELKALDWKPEGQYMPGNRLGELGFRLQGHEQTIRHHQDTAH
jgi:hypothetical protein